MENYLIPAKENRIDSEVDDHFGRSSWYLIVNSNCQLVEAIPGDQHSHHKGIFRWRNDPGYSKILSAHMGPGAYHAAEHLNIEIFMIPNNITVAEAVLKFTQGGLTALANADGLSCGGSCHH